MDGIELEVNSFGKVTLMTDWVLFVVTSALTLRGSKLQEFLYNLWHPSKIIS